MKIRFDPLKGKTQDINGYINMMKRRFSIIKKIVEEKKLQTQQAQWKDKKESFQIEKSLLLVI